MQNYCWWIEPTHGNAKLLLTGMQNYCWWIEPTHGNAKLLLVNWTHSQERKTFSENDFGNLSAAITWILWIENQTFYVFLKSLERDLSNGTIKVDIREIKVFDNLAIYTMDYNYNNSPWSEAEKWKIRTPKKFWIETHHLKGNFLIRFQKIKKFWHRSLCDVMVCWLPQSSCKCTHSCMDQAVCHDNYNLKIRL